MTTLQELAERYCCDDLSDKGTTHSYVDVYESLFEPIRHKPITLLEVGVKSGASIGMWQEYFDVEGTQIIGVDLTLDRPYQIDLKRHNITLLKGNATDGHFMSQFNDIDVFIDDGSHIIDHQIATLEMMLPKMNTGGIYVIEDVGYGGVSGKTDVRAMERLLALGFGELLDLRHERPGCHCNALFVVRT